MAKNCIIDVNQGPTPDHEKSTVALLPKEPVNYDAEEGVSVQPAATPKEKFDKAGFLQETGTAVRRTFSSGYVRLAFVLLGLLTTAMMARNFYLADQYWTTEYDYVDYTGQDEYAGPKAPYIQEEVDDLNDRLDDMEYAKDKEDEKIRDVENELEYLNEELEQIEEKVSENNEEALYDNSDYPEQDDYVGSESSSSYENSEAESAIKFDVENIREDIDNGQVFLSEDKEILQEDVEVVKEDLETHEEYESYKDSSSTREDVSELDHDIILVEEDLESGDTDHLVSDGTELIRSEKKFEADEEEDNENEGEYNYDGYY